MTRLEELKKKQKELKEEISALDNLQNGFKVLTNALFGAQANEGFRHFDPDNAEAITMNGQKFIQSVGTDMEAYMNLIMGPGNYHIYSDTDSVYYTMDKLVRKVFPEGSDKKKIVEALDQFCKKKIAPQLQKACDKIAEGYNVVVNELFVKREKICESGVWTGKKKYVLYVWDDEGVRFHHPEVKVTGLEVKRSSTPKAVRDMLEETLEVILAHGEKEVQKLFTTMESRFRKLSVTEMAFPRGVNEISKYQLGDSSVPIHVRAALLYNKLVKDNELDSKYQYIFNGTKIRFIYLKMPNPCQNNVIGFMDKLPPEFKLDGYIDVEEQFKKTFANPLESIMKACGWTSEPVYNLEDFFG